MIGRSGRTSFCTHSIPRLVSVRHWKRTRVSTRQDSTNSPRKRIGYRPAHPRNHASLHHRRLLLQCAEALGLFRLWLRLQPLVLLDQRKDWLRTEKLQVEEFSVHSSEFT